MSELVQAVDFIEQMVLAEDRSDQTFDHHRLDRRLKIAVVVPHLIGEPLDGSKAFIVCESMLDCTTEKRCHIDVVGTAVRINDLIIELSRALAVA